MKITGPRKNHDERRETALYSKLREIVAGYGCRHFVVYALEGDELRLVFSCGPNVLWGSPDDGALSPGDYPALRALLDGKPSVLVRDVPDETLGSKFLEQVGASAAFRLAFGGSSLGFVLLGSFVPDLSSASTTIGELENVFALFAGRFAQSRSANETERYQLRAESKLRELQQGLELLLIPDQMQIIRMVLRRALDVVGSASGMLWVLRGQKWDCDLAIGNISPDSLDGLESVLHRCSTIGKTGLVSSVSGEETWDFDVETIHIASVVIFPLKTLTQFLGCIVAFDTTISSDVIDVVEGVALVGATAIENWHNAQRMLESERLASQMSLAAKMQKRLLPNGQAKLVGVSTAHYSKYCDEAGGDYVDIIAAPEPYLCNFAVGDVSGHGLGAAMLMVDLRARLRTQMDLQPLWTPRSLLTYLNNTLHAESAPEEFVTLFFGSVDVRMGVLRYASAGHEPPLLYKARQSRWQQLESTGLPLGMDGDSAYEQVSIEIERGDILVVPTDGATEARNPERVPLGAAAITAAVEHVCEADAQRVMDEVVNTTLEYCRGAPFTDDVTFLVLKFEQIRLRVEERLPEPVGNNLYHAMFTANRAEKDGQLAALRPIIEQECGNDASGVYMSLEEALANAIVHGAKGRFDCTVELQLWRTTDSILIDIRHEGTPFDIGKVLPTIDEAALQRENGRGLLMMMSLLDEVVYTPDGLHLQLTKYLSGTGRSRES